MNETQNMSSQADFQNSAPADAIKQQAAQDINLIENLVQAGLMTQTQGQNLMKFVTEKAFEKYTNQSQTLVPEQISNQRNFPREIPEFFSQDGRSDVFDYLKNTNADFDDDELSKISSLVERIENTAIDRYLKAQEHEKTLNLENESAKQRLRSNAQNAPSDGNANLVFTREQIGRMSGAEFAKHERAIMEQLRKGLIR